MIKILDYGMGNCGSIKNMLRYIGTDSTVVTQPKELEDATGIILPGVGSYDHGVRHLQRFKEVLECKVLHEKTPFLGICLGMQLLLDASEEGNLDGLGWVSGEVRRFDFSSLADRPKLVTPHMGWNEIMPTTQTSLLQSVEQSIAPRFYFVHSYHAARVPEVNQMALSHYGYNFTCGIQNDNIYGVQFHPEKSHKFGKQFFKRFVELVQC